MPAPATPTLTVTALSTTSFQAVVASTSGTAVLRLYYRNLGTGVVTTGPTATGSGTLTVTGLAANGQYMVWCVADEGGAGVLSLPAFAFTSLALSDAFSTAVHARWNGDAVLTALVTGGLWTGEVPEGTAPPYAWLDLPQTKSHPLFEGQFEGTRFVLHVFAQGAALAEQCAAQVKARFDYEPLSFATAAHIYTFPVDYRLLPERMRYKDGTQMFRALLSYDALVQRTRN